MASWDTATDKQTTKAQAIALRAQLVDLVAPSSPFWRDRLKAMGRPVRDVATIEGLAAVPAVGERDLCPDGDPAAAAALVIQAGESGFALHAEGPTLRRALVRRLVAPGAYAAVVEADTRPTSFVWAGRSLRFPIASTRGDLDVIARAGARMWGVLGLGRGDVLVGVTPAEKNATQQALELMALGAGAPALFAGPTADELAEALRLLPATVLALPTETAARLLDDLDEAGAPFGSLRTLLLLGAPSTRERHDVDDALQRAGAVRAKVLALHVADGHRLPWAQSATGSADGSFVTSPDLELLQVVDPETGEATSGAGELVVTQLGLRGSALVRWRTGDLVQAITTASDGAGRTVPRLVGLRRGALVPTLHLASGPVTLDLRAVSGVLAGRADLEDWRIEVRRDARTRAEQLLIHLAVRRDVDPGDVAVAVAREVRTATTVLPTQVILADRQDLPGRKDRSRVLVDA